VVDAARHFTREQLRTPFALILLVTLPAFFVWWSGDVLSEFAQALGGEDLGDRATALGAGWGAGFVAGALGFFQVASSRGADRRLAFAGLGSARVAAARLFAALSLGVVIVLSAFLALWALAGVAHPAHAAIAVGAFTAIYLGLGAIIGSVVSDPLSGSLVVAFVFLLDVFSGPGMGNAGGLPTPSRSAGELLMAAGAGTGSPGSDWIEAAITVAVAIAFAGLVFLLSARRRGG
jgi:hypothetical protein